VDTIKLEGNCEPTFDRGLFIRTIYLIKENEFKGCLTTNGTLLDNELIEHLIKIKWNYIVFSIDSCEHETNDFLRGMEGALQKSLNNLELLDELKKKHKSEYPEIAIQSVVSKYNCHQIEKMVKIFSEYNIARYDLVPMTEFISCLKKHRMSDAQASELERSIPKLCDILARRGIRTSMGSISSKYIINNKKAMKTVLPKLGKGPDILHCYFPWFYIYISHEGDVTICGEHKPPEENIGRRTLPDIWYGQSFERVRKTFAKKNPAFCDKCCIGSLDEMKSVRRIIENEKENIASLLGDERKERRNVKNEILITNRCNNNCIFCDIEKNGTEKKLEQIFMEIDSFNGDTIIFGGAEPTIRPDIIDIVTYAKKKGNRNIQINSNGRRFCYKEFCKAIIKAGAKRFNIRLFGHTSELHGKLTTTPESFEQTVTGIENLIDLGAEVSIRIKVMEENFKNLNRILKFSSYLLGEDVEITFDVNIPPSLRKKFLSDLRSKNTSENKIEVEFDNNIKRYLGIIADDVFVGPETVHLDINNACNDSCLYCWYHSPLVSVDKEWLRKRIDFKLAKKIINNLHDIRVKNVLLSGIGDPLSHPDIMNIIRYIKSRGIKVTLFSNGLLFTKDMMREFVERGLDHIFCNLSCIDGESYKTMHPGRKKSDFTRIRENLMYLKKLKAESGKKLPLVETVNVMTKCNYKNILPMYNLAQKVGADMVRYTIIQVDNELKLKPLQPDDEQISEMKKQYDELKEIAKRSNIDMAGDFEFQANNVDTRTGCTTCHSYDGRGCFAGWFFSRILVDGTVLFCCNYKKIATMKDADFEQIWKSHYYNEIRKTGKYFDRKRKMRTLDGKMFLDGECEKCGCYEINNEVYSKLKKFGLL